MIRTLIILLMFTTPFVAWSGETTDTNLVRLHSVIPDLLTDVRYATENNFTKTVLYASDTLWARDFAAQKLAKAQEHAKSIGLQLKVYDAYRPPSVQRFMWSLVPDERYVADPKKGSRHNRGCAFDLTLCTADGVELDMGTDYDDFTEKAAADYKDLPEICLENRKLLLKIMNAAGFDVLPTEWWHFDARGWEQYSIVEP